MSRRLKDTPHSSNSPVSSIAGLSPLTLRNAAAQPRPKATRSRAGCMICRSRRVKCDQAKPECQRCISYGAECVYPEKKIYDPEAVADKLDKRHKASHTVPNSDHGVLSYKSPLPSSHPFMPTLHTPIGSVAGIDIPPNASYGRLTQVRQMDPIELLMALCQDTRMGQFFSGPLDPPDFLRGAFPDEDDLRCFHHCFTYTLSTFVVYEEVNPWTDHVVPLFLFSNGEAPMSTSALRLGTLATGAVHLSSLEEKGSAPNTEGKSRELGLRYRDEGVKLLRIAQHVPEEMNSDVFLAAAMMISCADLLGANQRWREVARLAHASVRYRGGCETILFGDSSNSHVEPTPLRICLIEHLVLMDMCVSLTTGQPFVVMTETSEWWDKLGSNDANKPDSAEYASGIHRSLIRLAVRGINILFEGYHLSKYITLPPLLFTPIGRPNLPKRITELCNDLDIWRNRIFPTIKNKRTRDGSLALWHGLQLMIKRELMGRMRQDKGVQRHALETLDICAGVGAKVEYMNWPLLIACSVLQDPEHRQRAREVLKSFIYQCSYEVVMAESVAEECWRRMDQGMDDEACSWREILIEMGCAVMLG
ncbi:hypothetical protein L204_101229 [Cryptococcus depauperatus]